MQTVTDHTNKLAATLKSLSFEPLADAPPRRAKRFGLVTLAIVILVAAITAAFFTFRYEPALLLQIEGMFFSVTNASGKTTEARIPASLAQADQQPDKLSPAQSIAPPLTEITGSGFVVTPRTTTVFSKYEGRITDIAVEPGDRVEKGQILIKLEDATARFALEQAQADKISANLSLAASMIDLKQARASLDRIEILARRDAVSKQRLDETRTAWRSAANAVDKAQQEIADADLAIRIAQERLEELIIRAPFAGTVTLLNAHTGDTVLARADSVRDSQSLLTLADTKNMMIDADVAETNIANLHPGLRGEALLDGFPDHPFKLEVVRLSPVVSVEKGTITLRLSLINPPQGIRPNMAARIRLLLPRPAQRHESSPQTGDATQ
tara:strand:+ start:49609 stop:50754 length:1146 start_codon:yes stop_codon:yes gene_type:complete